MRKWIFCCCFSALTACGDATLISEAKDAAAYDLLDPSSAMFREVKVTKDGVVCGEINAKNRMNAYVGFKPFYAEKVGGKLFAYIVSDATSALPLEARYDQHCLGKSLGAVENSATSIGSNVELPTDDPMPAVGGSEAPGF